MRAKSAEFLYDLSTLSSQGQVRIEARILKYRKVDFPVNSVLMPKLRVTGIGFELIHQLLRSITEAHGLAILKLLFTLKCIEQQAEEATNLIKCSIETWH